MIVCYFINLLKSRYKDRNSILFLFPSSHLFRPPPPSPPLPRLINNASFQQVNHEQYSQKPWRDPKEQHPKIFIVSGFFPVFYKS